MGGRKWFERLNANHWLAELMALIGGIVYFIQSCIYAHSQESVLDEGLYLLKGYLFATDQYQPFQEYGPWTNHMPLSFLIPGYFQVWFGEGIRTGRFLSIGLGILFLAAFWIITNRFGGRWWAALAIWVVALNPAVIKIYSVMTSQVLVICMLMWVFVFALGEDRKPWQIILGAALAGMLPLTRLNLVPLLPLLLLYILWEHGIKRGVWAFVIGLVTFFLGQALFWPGIMRLWASWLPSSLTPFLDGWRRVSGGQGIWNLNVSFETRIVSFFEGIRYHFVSIVGTIAALFLWLSLRRDGRKFREVKTFFFLLVFFGVMFIFHAWASLIKNYCVFCFSSYLSFFGFTGFLIFILGLSNWHENTRVLEKKWMWLLVVLISLGIGFSVRKMISTDIFLNWLMDGFFSISIPRLKNGQFQNGTITWLGMIANKSGWDYVEVLAKGRLVFTMFLAALFGVIGTGSLIWLFSKLETKKQFCSRIPQPISSFVLLAFVVLGALFSLTTFMAGGRDSYDCNQDVIASYEQNGAYLAKNIPPGSKVYWKGWVGLSVLLYQTDAEFFPAQFNNVYSYRDGGDPDELVKSGLWNDELAHFWAEEADIILIAERYYSGWLAEYVENGEFREIAPTSQLNPCSPGSRIHIFRRLP